MAPAEVPAEGAGRSTGRSAGGDRAGAPARGLEAQEVVGADHAPARGHREGLHHAWELDCVELRADGAAQVHPPHLRDRKPGRRERGAGQILAAGGSGRARGVVREPQGGGGAVRDLDGGVVGGDHRRDGPVAMRRENLLDDRCGIREIDPDSTVDLGDERVLSLTRDEHLETEIASRLQVGVYPVAAGRGDQQNPGGSPSPFGTRGSPRQDPGRILHPIGIRRRPQPPLPPPAMPHAPQVLEPPVAWNTLLNTNVEPVSRVTKSISTPRM